MNHTTMKGSDHQTHREDLRVQGDRIPALSVINYATSLRSKGTE